MKNQPQQFVTYLRVSTGKQSLGLEAQRETVQRFLAGKGWPPAAEFVERESGKRNDRPELEKALSLCRALRATLVVAKLDRLARNQAFLMALVDSAVDVIFCDLPNIPTGATGRFILQQMAGVAELEAGMISERTKAALAVVKASGKTLGGFRGHVPTNADRQAAATARTAAAVERASDLRPLIEAARADGETSNKGLARWLNSRGVPSPRGGTWQATSVGRLLQRMA
tara:strand:- start:425 stop:1108 length:684 start_codon:yes stop_codon:yes gene_type:complete